MGDVIYVALMIENVSAERVILEKLFWMISMPTKTSFRSAIHPLCSSGGKELVKNSIEPQRHKQQFTKKDLFSSDGNVKLTVELRRQILTLRDVLGFSSVKGTATMPELLTTTVEDLYKTYNKIISKLPISDIRRASTKQGLAYFGTALISVGDSWTKNQKWRANIKNVAHDEHEKIDSEKLIGDVLITLDCIINLAKKKPDVVEVDNNDLKKTKVMSTVLKKRPSETRSGESSSGSSPISPTSVLPDFPDDSNDDLFGDFTMPFKLRAVKIMGPTEVKQLPYSDTSLHWLNSTAAEEPPADKKVKLNLEAVTVQGTLNSCSEMMEVDEQGSNLAKLKLQAGKHWLEQSLPHPELSTKVSQPQGQLLEFTSKPLTKISTSKRPKSVEVPSNEPELSMLPAPESKNPFTLQPLLPISPPSTPPSTFECTPTLVPTPLPPSTLKSPPSPVPQPSLKGPLPPPPLVSSKGFPPLPPMPPTSGGAPPTPPSLGGRVLGPRSATKLKRSSQMGNLYRLLKGKVEGSSLKGKSTQGRKGQPGSGGANKKQGMADALAEITKRSAYFQQIEEDTRKYAKVITEMKSTITAFQTKDMAELIKFHKHVESQLEHLTDESQVLARFEGFPTKKLECLRMAAALYSKLDMIHTTIVNWKIVPPMSELLLKVDTYFTKIKGEVDTIERTKDEELKKFKSHNIQFDFNILVKIKESMVDLSSSCMELALKESKDAKSSPNKKNSPKKASEAPVKMLWKAFQFAYRVYTFAGGQDDRAERITRELAHEIENEPEF